MFTFSASGEICYPNMIIYHYKRIPQDIVNSVPPNWGVGHSDSGRMKSEVFYEYIEHIFHPFLIEKGIKLPVILLVDGHKSHLTYQLSQLCSDLNIILIALYPNSTRILQPADVAAFHPLKSSWKKGVFEKTVKPDTLINCFKACGLFPWNPDEIDYMKCLGKNDPSIDINKYPIASETYNNITLLIDKKLYIAMFSEIVGPETMEKLKNINRTIETKKNIEELYILHRLFEKLNNKADFEICKEVSSEELNSDNIQTSSAVEEN